MEIFLIPIDITSIFQTAKLKYDCKFLKPLVNFNYNGQNLKATLYSYLVCINHFRISHYILSASRKACPRQLHFYVKNVPVGSLFSNQNPGLATPQSNWNGGCCKRGLQQTVVRRESIAGMRSVRLIFMNKLCLNYL